MTDQLIRDLEIARGNWLLAKGSGDRAAADMLRLALETLAMRIMAPATGETGGTR